MKRATSFSSLKKNESKQEEITPGWRGLKFRWKKSRRSPNDELEEHIIGTLSNNTVNK